VEDCASVDVALDCDCLSGYTFGANAVSDVCWENFEWDGKEFVVIIRVGFCNCCILAVVKMEVLGGVGVDIFDFLFANNNLQESLSKVAFERDVVSHVWVKEK